MLTFFTLHFSLVLWFLLLLAEPTSAAPASPSKVCKRTDGATRTTSAMHAFTSTSTDKSTVSLAASTSHSQHSRTSHVVTSIDPTSTPTIGNSSQPTEATSATASTPSSTSPSSGTPRFVIYADEWVSATKNHLPDVKDIEGYNVLALSFWLTTGAADQAETWTQLSASDRKAAKKAYSDAGVSVIVSLFGSTDTPTTKNEDPTDMANTVADFVKQYDLDGVDVDYEDFAAFNNGQAVDWLITFTSALRKKLPAEQFTISHAPVAPWFSNSYKDGGYLAINKAVGDAIDWYNVQFYNQGKDMYTDCNGLITESGSASPNTAVMQLVKAGVDPNKIVIGKPGIASDATNGGFMESSELAKCIKQATAEGWKAGIMSWQYPNADTKWVTAARGSAFPL